MAQESNAPRMSMAALSTTLSSIARWKQRSKFKALEPEVDERNMYAAEKLDNFRWLSKLVGSHAEGVTLTQKNIVPADVKEKVDEIGQYSELVYSDVPVDFLFEEHNSLKEAKLLLDYQEILSDCNFRKSIRGPSTHLSAFVAYRKSTGQLVVSISGSSCFRHAVENLRASHAPWPLSPHVKGFLNGPDTMATEKEGPTVHHGFLRLYEDIADDLKEEIKRSLDEDKPHELVITGHSMGGSVSYLLCMDLLSEGPQSRIPLPKKFCLATYGTPRTGDRALVKHYRSLVEGFERRGRGFAFEEYSVKAYNDGVPAVPLERFRWAHFSARPLYAHHKRLYRVPPNHAEPSIFYVDSAHARASNESQTRSQPGPTQAKHDTIPQVGQANVFSKGGHNYYNGRDLECFRRVTSRLAAAGFPKDGWKEKFDEGSPAEGGMTSERVVKKGAAFLSSISDSVFTK